MGRDETITPAICQILYICSFIVLLCLQTAPKASVHKTIVSCTDGDDLGHSDVRFETVGT